MAGFERFAVVYLVLLFLSSCFSDRNLSPLKDSGYVHPNNIPACAKNCGIDQYGDYIIIDILGIEQTFRWIPAGTLVVDKSPFLPEDRTRADGKRELINKNGFWMADSECTQELWAKVRGENPLYEGEGSGYPGYGARLPIDKIEPENILQFLQKIQMIVESGQIRLPTETEWEYACRAGTTGMYAGDLDEMAWYEKRSQFSKMISRESTYAKPIKIKKPNKWGLYDMHGNVSEKCLGVKPLVWSGAIANTNSEVLRKVPQFVSRGGRWTADPPWCRSDTRNVATLFDGFRFILTFDGKTNDTSN